MPVVRLGRVALIVFIWVSATGCEGKSNPAGPSSAPAPTVTGVVISGPDAIRTGLSASYTATATLSDGTTQGVTPRWISGNVGAASVDNAGRLEGHSHGSTNLTAFHEGHSASKTVQVVNSYEGTWVGRYLVRVCDRTGSFGGMPCKGLGRVGDVLPITLTLFQTGSDQSQVNGTVIVDGFFFGTALVGARMSLDVTGTVTGDGRLILGGSSEFSTWDDYYVFEIGGWDTSLTGPGAMTGRWAQKLSWLFTTEASYQETELVTMTQTSTSAAR